MDGYSYGLVIFRETSGCVLHSSITPLEKSHATERLTVLIYLLFLASICEDDYYCYMTSKLLTNKALLWPEYPKPQLHVTSLMDFAKEKKKQIAQAIWSPLIHSFGFV